MSLKTYNDSKEYNREQFEIKNNEKQMAKKSLTTSKLDCAYECHCKRSGSNEYPRGQYEIKKNMKSNSYYSNQCKFKLINIIPQT